MIGLLLAGMVAFQMLAVSALPQVDYPTIVVSTFLPGGSAETMASSVTTPLERQFGQMPALASVAEHLEGSRQLASRSRSSSRSIRLSTPPSRTSEAA